MASLGENGVPIMVAAEGEDGKDMREGVMEDAVNERRT
jgi:hypothetical protein